MIIVTHFSEGQHIFLNCCHIPSIICGVKYKEVVKYVHFDGNISLYINTEVAHVTMKGELL